MDDRLERRLGLFPADEHRHRQHDRGRHLHDFGPADGRPGGTRPHARALARGRGHRPVRRLCYGELGAAIPRAGGEYAFLSASSTPSVGFLSGWVSFFVGFSAPIAASAIGFSEYLTRAFPGPEPGPGRANPPRPFSVKKAPGHPGHRGFTLDPHPGDGARRPCPELPDGAEGPPDRRAGRGGFASGRGASGTWGGAPSAFDFGGWKTIGLSLMWIMFAYSGWNASAYIGGEIRDPERNLPRSLSWGRASSSSSTR
jgi:basic amino acid/polyamine antiporter, APA family